MQTKILYFRVNYDKESVTNGRVCEILVSSQMERSISVASNQNNLRVTFG